MTFDGFISYSHAADGRLAPAVQRGLHRLAKPWHRRRALWIFRDQTGLAVTPGLWSSIQTALDGSEYFVLLASPEAAHSPWVNREIEHWMATKSADRILPVVTDGSWAWDTASGDFTADSTAVPAALRGVFSEEPFFLDLRWARGSEHLSLQHTRFRDAIAQLAAPMHGVSKDELEGEDVRQHRRARRLRAGAAATLAVLTVLATATGVSAMQNADRARAAAAEAVRQQKLAEAQRGSAERSAAEANRQQELARHEQERAADATGAADRAERLAEEKQNLADRATVEAQRQQRLADDAAARARDQQWRAQEAATRAQRLQKEADRLARIAREQRQRILAAAAEADRQQARAEQQQARAEQQQARAEQQQRIAISRRLLNQTRSTLHTDPRTALMLGAAAQTVEPGADTRRELANLLTVTNYAGTVGDVTAMAYGPGGVLATAGPHGRVSVWNVADPARPVRLGTLTDVMDSASPLLVSRDGRLLVFLNEQGTAVLWNVAGRSGPVRIGTLAAGHAVSAVAMSADGTTLVTGLYGGEVVVWDMAVPSRPARLATITEGGDYQALEVELSPDGRTLIVDKMRFKLGYDLTDRANPVEVTGLSKVARAEALAFSPDGTWLASGDQRGRVTLSDRTGRMWDWDQSSLAEPPPAAKELPPASIAPPPTSIDEPPSTLASPPPMPTFDPDVLEYQLGGLQGVVNSVAFSPDGRWLVAGDEQGTATVWEVTSDSRPVPVTSVRARSKITATAFAPEGDSLVTLDGSATATLWVMPPRGRPNQLATLGVAGTSVQAVSFRPDGRSLVAAGTDGSAHAWNVADPRRPVAGAVRTLRGGKVHAVAFSPDHRAVATVGVDGRLTLADAGSPLQAVPMATLPAGKTTLRFSPDGRTLAVATNDTPLILFDVADRRRPVRLATLSGYRFGAAVAFSPDGRTLATGGSYRDPRLILWDVTDRARPRRLVSLAGPAGTIVALTFSPDGRMLAGAGRDATMLWNLTNRARPHELATLSGPGTELTFHPDRRTLAVSGDRDVLLWDISAPTTPILLASVPSSYGTEAVEFHRDGHTMAVVGNLGGNGGVVTLWDYRRLTSLRTDPARFACAVAGRGLTASEWARYVPELRYRRSC